MLKKKGFTLIELLVVVVILAVLAAIAIPQYNLAVEKTRSREAVLVLARIANSLREQYLAIGTNAYASRPNGMAVFDSLNVDLGPSFVRGSTSQFICTELFMYTVECNPWVGKCGITAFRLGGRRTPDSCNVYAMQESKYILDTSVFFTKPTVRTCYNWSTGDHEFGIKFCAKLLEEGVIDTL